MRFSMPRCAAVLAALALVIGCGDDDDSTPVPAGSLPPRGKLLGISEGSFTRTGRDPALDLGVTPERTADDVLAAGANSARVPFSWWETQPQPGQVDQGYLALIDRFVKRFEAGGGRVLFFLGGPPPWASTKPGNPAAAPRADADMFFARFAASVAKRYPRAAAIETWNEPNTTFGWLPRPDPAHYTRMHKLAARAIRAVNPRVKVVVGGLASAVEDTPQVKRPGRFLAQMYDAGLRPSDYDALAFHAYPIQREGKVESLAGGDFRDGLSDFQDGYHARDPDARIWITETGLTTSGPGAVVAQRQAAGIGPLVQTLFAEPRVDAIYVHALYDQTTKPLTAPTRGYGLLTARRSAAAVPKPAFCALRRLTRKPRPFPGCR